MKIPQQLIDVHFRLVMARGKAPNVEKEWQTKNNYAVSQAKVDEILASGMNYGFTCPTGFAFFIDADTKEVQETLDNFSWTFRYSTGTPGHFQYAYFSKDKPVGHIPLRDGAYIKGKGGFVVGPGSTHPNGRKYGLEVRYAPIAVVSYDALMGCLAPFIISGSVKGNSSNAPFERRVGISEKQKEEVVEQFLDVWMKADHRRHELTLSICGYLQRKGFTASDLEQIIGELVAVSKKGDEHIKTVRRVFNEKPHKWGLPRILQIENEVSALGN